MRETRLTCRCWRGGRPRWLASPSQTDTHLVVVSWMRYQRRNWSRLRKHTCSLTKWVDWCVPNLIYWTRYHRRIWAWRMMSSPYLGGWGRSTNAGHTACLRSWCTSGDSSYPPSRFVASIMRLVWLFLIVFYRLRRRSSTSSSNMRVIGIRWRRWRRPTMLCVRCPSVLTKLHWLNFIRSNTVPMTTVSVESLSSAYYWRDRMQDLTYALSCTRRDSHGNSGRSTS